MTLDELKKSILVIGDGSSSTWDRDWRLHLVENVAILASQLAEVGYDTLYIDGSFVEQKDHPNDIDGYFDCDYMDLATGKIPDELNLIDPFKVWTWDPESRMPYRGYAKKQLPMWHKYRVEIYPNTGLPSGIVDGRGNSLRFDQAFRQSRFEDRPKGIIKLVS
jgi:hypothetical protein